MSPRLYASHDDRRLNLDVVLTNAELSDANLNSSPYDVAIVIGQGHFPGNHVQRLMGDAVFPRLLATVPADPWSDVEQNNGRPLIYGSTMRFVRVGGLVCLARPDTASLSPWATFSDSNMTIGLAAKGVGIALARTWLDRDKLRDATLVLLRGVGRCLHLGLLYVAVMGGNRSRTLPG